MVRPYSNDRNAEGTASAEALSKAEQRAEAAERCVQQLEHKLQNLENSGSERNSSASTQREPADHVSDSNGLAALRSDEMMNHLLSALESGQDIGHYGRLVFAMVAHHFLSENELLDWLTRDQSFTREQALALLRQVEIRDYNPPRRERILEWQSQQQFPILPRPEDPDCGNVYRNLKFPSAVYEHIEEYREEKAEAEERLPADERATDQRAAAAR